MRSKEFIFEKAFGTGDLKPTPGATARNERVKERILTFINKISKGSPFQTTDGKSVVIKKDPKIINNLKAGIIPLSFPIVPEGNIKLSNLLKTSEFGGQPGKENTAEVEALQSLDQQIKSLLNGKSYVLLRVGSSVVHAAGAVNTPGTPKSDFEIINEKGKAVAWISHKDGSPANPKKFGQWAGVSHYLNYPEVKDFVDAIRANPPVEGETSRYREIKDPELRMKAMYGSNYGSGTFNIQNVTTILQGPVKIEKEGRGYKLTALKEFPNGTVPPPEYTPIFTARFMARRNDQGVPNTRISIYPFTGRKIVGI